MLFFPIFPIAVDEVEQVRDSPLLTPLFVSFVDPYFMSFTPFLPRQLIFPPYPPP